MRSVLMLAAVLAVGCGAAAWFLSAPRPVFPLHRPVKLAPGDVSRGALIFAAGDCASCHASPGQSNRKMLGGGMALSSPFGTFYPPNISPDPKDGIGSWTTADLANALLAGVSPRGTHYYPLFPYTFFLHMRLQDVEDLMAYLRTLPPVSGRPPSHDLPLFFKFRRAIGLWKIFFFDRSPLGDEPAKGEAWNRGRYLVEGVGHCAECHSTRNPVGAIEAHTRLAGGPDPSGVGYIPNITPGGIGSWSVRQISDALGTGITPELRALGSSMADVVHNLSMLPQSDRDAIAVYLKSLPAKPTSDPHAAQ